MEGSESGLLLFTTKFKADVTILGMLFLAIWGIRFIDGVLLRDRLNSAYAIQPRKSFSPMCLLMSPFLHQNRKHLFANTLPLLTLGWLVMLPETNVFWLVTTMAMLIGGLGIWLFGASNTRHLGASGLVMGYLGFLLSRGFFLQDTAAVLIAIVVGGIYFNLLRQIVPLQRGLSTTGHLFGFLGGVFAAWVLTWPWK